MPIPVEAVAPGHPDKLADYISDVVLDTYRKYDKNAKTAIEAVVYSGGIFITGEIRSTVKDIYSEIRERIVLSILKIYGEYQDEWIFELIKDPKRIRIELNQQSKELSKFANEDHILSGDQGVVIGYATDESPTYLPIAFSFSQRLMKRISALRLSGELPGNLPDGKCLVISEEKDAKKIEEIYLSLQYSKQGDVKTSYEKIRRAIDSELVFHYGSPRKVKVHINTDFHQGGPAADTGLTGRKLIVDSYGPTVLFGGGAYSGKDISKIDRLCAYYARWIAKHVVASGMANRCYVHYTSFIGMSSVLGFELDCLETEKVDYNTMHTAVSDLFSTKYSDMIDDLSLTNFIYEKTSIFGHFTRDDVPWEILDHKRIKSLKAYNAAYLTCTS